MDADKIKKRRRLIKLDTAEKWRAYEQRQQANLEKAQALESESADSDLASKPATNKKPKRTQEQLNRLVTQHGLDSRRNLKKVGLPDNYEFQSYTQLNRAVNALHNNITITELNRQTVEASARNAGVAVSRYRSYKADKNAANDGYTSSGNVPARVIRRREKRGTCDQNASQNRNKQLRSQQEEVLAERLGFPTKSAYATFYRNIISQRKSKRAGQSESDAVYQDKMSLYSEYPEDTNIGRFLRNKPDGAKHRFIGTNLTRIVNAAIDQTVSKRFQSLLWDEGGKRARYEAVVNRFRTLLEAELSQPQSQSQFREVKKIHMQHPVHEIMARFDTMRKRSVPGSKQESLRIR